MPVPLVSMLAGSAAVQVRCFLCECRRGRRFWGGVYLQWKDGSDMGPSWGPAWQSGEGTIGPVRDLAGWQGLRLRGVTDPVGLAQ